MPGETRKHSSEQLICGKITIAAIGDVMVHGPQLQAAWNKKNKRYDFEEVFSQVKDFLWAADLAIANLETTLPGRQKLYSSYPQFGSPDAIAVALKKAGVDIVNTANNHACDKGKLGLARTIKVLEKQGMIPLGTYSDKADYEKRRITVVELNNIRLAFLSYTYGVNDMPIPQKAVVNLIDRQKISEDISLAREKNPDFIIVLIHFGTEYERYPDDFQKQTVNFLFQEGADIILGSHPHVLQPFELKFVTDKYGDKKQRLVIYSLGNFVSNQRNRYCDGGIIFNFTLSKECSLLKGSNLFIEDVNYIPTWVYVANNKKIKKYHILPVQKYLKNDQKLQLPDEAYEKMLVFYRDTLDHLSLGEEDVTGKNYFSFSEEQQRNSSK
ncbi:MAG: CapA family protein [Syntrophaceae bacterium]|nr:CapA family protein [Syntrophaceae bacterium]